MRATLEVAVVGCSENLDGDTVPYAKYHPYILH